MIDYISKYLNFNIGIDIDGTITNEKLKENGILTEEEIYNHYSKCTPRKGFEVLKENNHNIYLITGRRDKYREITEKWLNFYGIKYKELIMFPNDFYILHGYNSKKYSDLKLDICINKDIHFYIDDHLEVVEMLNSNGIKSFKVEEDFIHAFNKILESM